MAGRTALVTGAGSGVGRAVALELARQGFSLVLVGRRPGPLQEVAQAISAAGGQALALPADVSDEQAVANLFDAVRTQCGRLDLLFNNAGVNAPGIAFEDLSADQWRRVVDINLTGAFFCAQAAFRLMKQQSPRGGRIINNGSISAHAPRPGSAPYTATKHAITGLTKTISLDGRKYDIACGQIDIGNAMTSMAERMSRGVMQANGEIAVEPMMDVAHVATSVAYMASLPLEANVQFMTVMASAMPFVGRG
ncbi:MAG: short-chain dehydrogenase/reductase [Paucimonas sp.]|nr:short-chain dehydrogenase/reductase [Paucimonas sp.]